MCIYTGKYIYIYTHIHRTLKAPNPKADKLKG